MLLSLLNGKDLRIASVELFSPACVPGGLLHQAAGGFTQTIKTALHARNAAIGCVEALVYGVEALVHPFSQRSDQMEDVPGCPLLLLADVAHFRANVVGGAPQFRTNDIGGLLQPRLPRRRA